MFDPQGIVRVSNLQLAGHLPVGHTEEPRLTFTIVFFKKGGE
jgi:hypothetical protein